MVVPTIVWLMRPGTPELIEQAVKFALAGLTILGLSVLFLFVFADILGFPAWLVGTVWGIGGFVLRFFINRKIFSN